MTDQMKKTRAAAYVRVSTARQATEGLSLDEQVRQVGAHIAAHDWQHVQTFVEAGVSGRKDDRPELSKLMKLVDSIDVLVIPKLDRLGRSTLHLLKVCDDLKTAGVSLVSLGDSIDTSTGAGQMLLEILAAVASFESVRIGERVASVTAARCAQGKSHGRAPYGYRPGGKAGLVIEPAEAAVVRRVFREYVNGASQLKLGRDLNNAGISAQRGGKWGQGSVSKILSNPVYAGRVRLNKKTYPGTHEPIIDAETWQKAVAIRKAAMTNHQGRTALANHALGGGMLRCGCGSAMSAVTKPTRTPGVMYEVYTCSGRAKHGPEFCRQLAVKRRPIDEAVWRFFEQVALDVDATRTAIAVQHDARLAEINALRAHADREAQKTASALTRIERDYRDEKLTAEQWSRFDAKLTSELEAANAQVARLDTQRATLLAEMAEVDTETVVLEQIGALRAMLVGEVRAGGREGVDSFRAALRRLFASFDLVDWRYGETPLLMDIEPTGDMAEAISGIDLETISDTDLEALEARGESAYSCLHPALTLEPLMALIPRVRHDVIDDWPDGDGFPALRRAALALRDFDANTLVT